MSRAAVSASACACLELVTVNPRSTPMAPPQSSRVRQMAVRTKVAPRSSRPRLHRLLRVMCSSIRLGTRKGHLEDVCGGDGRWRDDAQAGKQGEDRILSVLIGHGHAETLVAGIGRAGNLVGDTG